MAGSLMSESVRGQLCHAAVGGDEVEWTCICSARWSYGPSATCAIS
jgi:hypothetical protein